MTEKIENRRTVDGWSPKGFYLSQSALKSFNKYQRGEMCGIIFREQVILGNLEPDSSADADKGNYFENLCTGSLPRSGVVPEPEVYQKSGTAPSTGRTYKAGDVKEDWKQPRLQAKRFKEMLAHYGLKVIVAGVRLVHSDLLIAGTIDIVIQCPKENWEVLIGHYLHGGKIVPDGFAPLWEDCTFTDSAGVTHQGCIIVDLKYSGLIDDKWHEWGWHVDHIQDRESHVIQAKTYHIITGSKLPFMFWVFSSREDCDIRIFRIKFDEGSLQQFTLDAEKARKRIVAETQLGFQPHPSVKGCHACPLSKPLFRFEPDALADGGFRKIEVRGACEHQRTVPVPEAIFVGY